MKITRDVFLYPEKHIGEQLSEYQKQLYKRIYEFLRLPYEYNYPIDKYEDSYGEILVDFDINPEDGFIHHCQISNGEVRDVNTSITGFIVSEYMFGVKAYCPCDENHYNNIGVFWFNLENAVFRENAKNNHSSNINNLEITVAYVLDNVKASVWKNLASNSDSDVMVTELILPKFISDLIQSLIININNLEGKPTTI